MFGARRFMGEIQLRQQLHHLYMQPIQEHLQARLRLQSGLVIGEVSSRFR